MWCWLSALVAQMSADGLLAILAYAPLDLPALFSFALPHTCIWIPLDSAGGK